MDILMPHLIHLNHLHAGVKTDTTCAVCASKGA